MLSDLTGIEHRVLRPTGGLGVLRFLLIRLTRFCMSGKRELISVAGHTHYMHNLNSGRNMRET